MKPDAVLTDDQRKIRFRNSIKKKESRQTQNISREYIDVDPEDDEEEYFNYEESAVDDWTNNTNLIQVLSLFYCNCKILNMIGISKSHFQYIVE